MKILDGFLKGKTLPPIKSFSSKPTKQIAKQALFDILQTLIFWKETNALELFAGTGNIGLEMISRGTRHLTFVDNDKNACFHIQNLLTSWKIQNAKVICADYETFLKKNKIKFDLIFADPPYLKVPTHLLIPKLLNILNPNGILIFEHFHTDNYDKLPLYQSTKLYGQSAFSFFSDKPLNINS